MYFGWSSRFAPVENVSVFSTMNYDLALPQFHCTCLYCSGFTLGNKQYFDSAISNLNSWSWLLFSVHFIICCFVAFVIDYCIPTYLLTKFGSGSEFPITLIFKAYFSESVLQMMRIMTPYILNLSARRLIVAVWA